MIQKSRHIELRRSPRQRRGAVIVLFAVLLIVVMALLALSLDLGYMCTVKADLQGAVDAGALAGSGVILDGESQAVDTAKQYAEANLSNSGVGQGNGQSVTVQVGHWDANEKSFAAGHDPLDAVKVTARVANASLFFGKIIGTSKFSTEASAVATYRPRDIMLVLDVSGSMDEARNGVKKIDELRSAVVFFLNYLREADANDRVGFTYYSTNANLGTHLSLDLDHVEQELLQHLQPSGWTNIADGMQLALDEFNTNRRALALPLMVVLTDGAANMNQPGNWNDPTEAKARVIQRAQTAAQQKLPIFTMALDSQTSEVDVQLMEQVAQITSTESYHVLAGENAGGGSNQLKEAFRRVAANRPLRIVD